MVAPARPSRDRLAPVVIMLAAVAVPAAAFVAALSHRSDYAGHFVAGAGGTALLVGAVLAVTDLRSWLVVAVAAAAVVAGLVLEDSVFRLAIFDPVDVGNQSLGAVVVGCAALRTPRAALTAAAFVMAGVVLLVVGFRLAFA